MNQVQASEKKAKKIEHVGDGLADGLTAKVEQVRDIVENVRDKAEVAFRDKPYLVPVAAGALGLTVGVLLGSKITRFILFTAVGTVMSDVLGGQIKRFAGDFLSEFQNRLGEGDGEGEKDEAITPAK